jgi:hypothetical protein
MRGAYKSKVGRGFVVFDMYKLTCSDPENLSNGERVGELQTEHGLWEGGSPQPVDIYIRRAILVDPVVRSSKREEWVVRGPFEGPNKAIENHE